MHFVTSSKIYRKDSSHKCRFCPKARAPPSLFSQVYGWAKYKDEVPDV